MTNSSLQFEVCFCHKVVFFWLFSQREGWDEPHLRSGRREELDAPLVSSYARLFVTFMSTLYPLIHKKLHYILEIFLTNGIVVCNYMEFIKNRFEISVVPLTQIHISSKFDQNPRMLVPKKKFKRISCGLSAFASMSSSKVPKCACTVYERNIQWLWRRKFDN